MYAMLDSVISRRRDDGEVRNDFLQTLLRKHAKDGADDDGSNADKLTDSQLKDNILTLLVAGHDTTTAGLTWLIKFLGENPEVLQKLRVSLSELIQVVAASGFSMQAPASLINYSYTIDPRRKSIWRLKRG